ncbi:MAG: 4Fe-4S dicluster domain-containing protein [Desulfobacteraceae bacterium]|nr:4Fe-4S dicluster domain-containing protein [Desulfobacteraceae bacterium]
MDRRTFLKLAGTGSIAFASGCTANPEKTLYSLVNAPDDMVTGQPAWYASTCRECPAGCGIIAKNREGRAVKLEGNPSHPINRGKLCIRGQAALQDVYDPDRLKTPLLKQNNRWEEISYIRAAAILKSRIRTAQQKGPDRVRLISGVAGETLASLFSACMGYWNAGKPVWYEPYAFESLKQAHKDIFGQPALPSYRMEKADFLLGCGADFLETWLSPVEYARKFAHMRRPGQGRKAVFISIGPFQSLTAANADQWISCNPGSETAVLLGLIRTALERGKGTRLPEPLSGKAREVSRPYTQSKVSELTGISTEQLTRLAEAMLRAESPLILGSATAHIGEAAYETDLAATLLNLVLDPDASLFDFNRRHRVESANPRQDTVAFFNTIVTDSPDLVLIHQANPVFTLPPGHNITEKLAETPAFVISFSNAMDETAAMADLIFPTALGLETWDEYGGTTGLVSMLQPVMGSLTQAPAIGDVLLAATDGAGTGAATYKDYLISRLHDASATDPAAAWVSLIQQGGRFSQTEAAGTAPVVTPPIPSAANHVADALSAVKTVHDGKISFAAVSSLRFWDGRGANKPWLNEIPDPLTKVAWQTPVLIHPERMEEMHLMPGDRITIRTAAGELTAPAYDYAGLHPDMAVMAIGQGHDAYGRYARGMGLNPITLLAPALAAVSGGPRFGVNDATLTANGRNQILAHTDGSRIQHGRKIALSVDLKDLHGEPHAEKHGLTMHDFPLTLPTEEGYDPKRDMYKSHSHDTYRWGMVVDLDRCIGCEACAAACYAENNIGVVGETQIIKGREMAWLRVERYHDPDRPEKIIFLPMMCQHCDNAPCEPVCPVYAPHHSREGLNNQIYNRCIGTRFCAQNCPYKVRRFNWLEWKWPAPANLQLNPNVTVRGKGVMEKCSFCIQRIKDARNVAKNENRDIRDGEVVPACVQTCPTGALTFGSYMDKSSRLNKLVRDPRAYQVMGYINTKPAVIYLKKITQII